MDKVITHDPSRLVSRIKKVDNVSFRCKTVSNHDSTKARSNDTHCISAVVSLSLTFSCQVWLNHDSA